MSLEKIDTEIENVSDERPRYPHWLGQAGEGDCLRSIAEETEGDPVRYALATREEQQQSALALERAFPVCRPIGSSAIRASRAGPGVYRVGFPQSPLSRRQVVRCCKFKSCLLPSGGHARERRVLCRNSHFFAGRCDDIPSLMVRQVCMQN